MLGRATLISVACALFAGCASGYAEFYQPTPTAYLAQLTPGITPQLRTSTGSAARDAEAMYADGYWPIGYASFNGPVQNVQGALAEGRKIGATYVVVSANYAYTVSGALPITTPTSQTSYSSGTVDVYGSGGSASGMYSGTTTTMGSSTTYVPYSIPRYDQSAIFFAPLPRTGLGAWTRRPTDDEARALGTARAFVVRAVRAGSAAYNADILPGDVITQVNGTPISDDTVMRDAVASGRAHLTLNRSGQVIEKEVTVPAQW